MTAVAHDANADEIRGSNLTDFPMDGKITIRKKRKRYIISLLEIADFQSRVAGTNAHQLDDSFKSFIIVDLTMHLVDRRSLPLTVGSVNVEYFNNNDISLYLRNLKGLLSDHP